VLQSIAQVIEGDWTPLSLSPFGEPQLGRRGLYRPIGGAAQDWDQMALLWVLNQADGGNSLLDIAERAQKPFTAIHAAAEAAREAGLLREALPGERLRPGAAGAS
jgi:aminopeptidase-like protein